jgi:2-(1,2-epoxy-1,2-dihydrophenyl)acetyl-CoA isomerase
MFSWEWMEVEMAEESHGLRLERSGAVLRITLDRPPANAFDVPMAQTLCSALQSASEDVTVRCVWLTGTGRFFSAGQDVSTIADASPEMVQQALHEIYNPCILLLRTMPKPVLAAVNGPAAGMGLGLALAADQRLAARSARFIFGFTALGLTADCGTSALLPAWVGVGRAMRMAYQEEPLTAEQAEGSGLVDKVCEDSELEGQAAVWAERLAAGPTLALALTKQALNQSVFADLDRRMEEEASRQAEAVKTADAQEGVRAFLEKRRVAFRGA